MARPKIEIDPIEVRKLAERGMKTLEIADFFECSPDTLERRFAAEILKGRGNLKMSLRVKQIQVALGGNVTMLIFLGKQLLGQTDKIKMDLSQIPDEELVEEARKRVKDEKL